MIKVVHIQTGLPTSSNAAFRIHKGMLEHGIESSMFVMDTQRIENENLFKIKGPKKSLIVRTYNILSNLILSKKKEGSYSFSYACFGFNIANFKSITNSDVIYLHWINGGFLSNRSIKIISELGKPVVFFMHDMWTITGGCHHSLDCNNYTLNCEFCPIFINNGKKSIASKQFLIKKKLFARFDNLFFVAPSKWLTNCAKISGLTKDKPIFHIPNIVDDRVFVPIDKTTAKRLLNIADDKVIISFGSVGGTKNHFKGWSFLKEAIDILYSKNLNFNIEILIFGSDFDKCVADSIPFKTHFVGRLNDEISMVVVNNAADVFVSPSLAESFGLTFLENILCNTPAVGFDVGGVPDIIEHKINGYLAKYKDSEDLANGIIYCLEHKLQMTVNSEFNKDRILKKHIDLIEKISIKSFI